MLLAAALAASGAAMASCSSSDDGGSASNPADAGAEATTDEAGFDAASPTDAGFVDAKPRPVVCASQPCATSLVTTLGANADDHAEGFCALLDDGTVACWGANGAGQLGRGDEAGKIDSANAARVVGLSDVAMLDHTCAVDERGAVWCWGTGPFLRDGAGITTTRIPVKLDLPPATAVGLGHSTACAVVAEGVVCWGSNADGQLYPLTATPDDAGLLRSIAVPTRAPVRGVAVGRATFVLREDGALVTWGANPPIGRLSPMFPDSQPQAVDTLHGVGSFDLVHDNACVTAGGRGYCWGAAVVAPSWYGGSATERALPQPVIAPEPLVQIATTRTHVVDGVVQRYRWCAVGVSGSVYCGGLNENGQAGDGTREFAFDAIKVRDLPEPAAQVRTTPNATCALLTNGKVRCWGANYYGQLGNGENRGRSFVPQEVVLP